MPGKFDRYAPFDPVLMSRAKRKGVKVQTEDRTTNVRSVWIYDRKATARAQMWFDFPDQNGNVKIIASAFDPNSSAKWGQREERLASRETLEKALDELWSYMTRWAGPGALT